jgi:hypothetical protein
MKVTSFGLDLAKNVSRRTAWTPAALRCCARRCVAPSCSNPLRNCCRVWSAWKPARGPGTGRANCAGSAATGAPCVRQQPLHPPGAKWCG